MASFYVDEDFPRPVVLILRDLGHDLITAYEAGFANIGESDNRVLQFAIKERRIVLTHNRRDFRRLHSQLPNHAGIILCTRDEDMNSLAARIDAVVRPGELLDGRLITVIRPNPSQKRRAKT